MLGTIDFCSVPFRPKVPGNERKEQVWRAFREVDRDYYISGL
jgi:hypothetical protein